MSSAVQLPPADYERSDAPPRQIVGVALGLAAAIVLTLLVSIWIYRAHYRELPPTNASDTAFSFRGGADERTSIERDWAEQDRLTRERLETYGWVDRRAGIVRIPIERAMEQLATDTAPAPTGGVRR